MASHHKAAEKHLDDAVTLLIQAKASIENAKDRNAAARAVHEGALEYHHDGLATTVARDQEADDLLQGLTAIGLAD